MRRDSELSYDRKRPPRQDGTASRARQPVEHRSGQKVINRVKSLKRRCMARTKHDRSGRRSLPLPGRTIRVEPLIVAVDDAIEPVGASFIRLPLPRPTAAVQRRALFRGHPTRLAFWERRRLTSSKDTPPDRATEKCVDHPCCVLRL
jgi:hypothetical protein